MKKNRFLGRSELHRSILWEEPLLNWYIQSLCSFLHSSILLPRNLWWKEWSDQYLYIATCCLDIRLSYCQWKCLIIEPSNRKYLLFHDDHFLHYSIMTKNMMILMQESVKVIDIAIKVFQIKHRVALKQILRIKSSQSHKEVDGTVLIIPSSLYLFRHWCWLL